MSEQEIADFLKKYLAFRDMLHSMGRSIEVEKVTLKINLGEKVVKCDISLN